MRVAGSLDDHQRGEIPRLLQLPPRRHVADRVRAEHQEQAAVGRGERVERVIRDGRRAALDLDARSLDTVDAVDRRRDQRKPVDGRRDDGAALLPRIPGDHHEHSIQPEGGAGVDRGHDVAHVHWVERAPEDTDSLDPGQSRGQTRDRRSHFRNATVIEASYARREMPLDDPPPNRAAHVLVRVWLPDRPGALGLVASRIGAVRGDIVGVDVLERGANVAVDEFAVDLADEALVSTLVREIEEVDGVSVEEVRVVGHFPDARLDALESAAALCEATTVADLHATLASQTMREFLADWTVVVQGGRVLAYAGDGMPDADVLDALVTGTSASTLVVEGAAGPDDLAVASFTAHDAALLLGRAGHPLRRRERGQLLALVRIADRAWRLLADYNVAGAHPRNAPT